MYLINKREQHQNPVMEEIKEWGGVYVRILIFNRFRR